MTRVITATYESKDAIRNTVNDLTSTGIPSEKIFIDEGKAEVKVAVAEIAIPEISEILRRHNPRRLV